MSTNNSNRGDNPIRVLIGDDHEISRIGIRRLLSGSHDIEIVAEAVSGQQTIDLVKTLRPQVVLLDILMPGMSGIEAAQRIKMESADTLIIMLSSSEDEQQIERAMYAGADGYLSKGVGSEELTEAIRNVTLGERVFSRTIIDQLEGKQTKENSEPPISLTKREEEIVALVAKGMTSQDIAKKLYISPRTVETHRARIMDKLGVNNAAGLVRFALLHSTYFDLRNNGNQ